MGEHFSQAITLAALSLSFCLLAVSDIRSPNPSTTTFRGCLLLILLSILVYQRRASLSEFLPCTPANRRCQQLRWMPACPSLQLSLQIVNSLSDISLCARACVCVSSNIYRHVITNPHCLRMNLVPSQFTHTVAFSTFRGMPGPSYTLLQRTISHQFMITPGKRSCIYIYPKSLRSND